MDGECLTKVTLNDLENSVEWTQFIDRLKARPEINWIIIVGGLASRGWTDNDVDLVIVCDEQPKLRKHPIFGSHMDYELSKEVDKIIESCQHVHDGWNYLQIGQFKVDIWTTFNPTKPYVIVYQASTVTTEEES